MCWLCCLRWDVLFVTNSITFMHADMVDNPGMNKTFYHVLLSYITKPLTVYLDSSSAVSRVALRRACGPKIGAQRRRAVRAHECVAGDMRGQVEAAVERPGAVVLQLDHAR